MNLIIESAAAEAKRRGLEARPFGYWEKNGEVVARTVDDKLVPVNGEEEKEDSDSPKPTTMSADQAGTSPDNTIRPSDVEQDGGPSEPEQPQTPQVAANPHRLTLNFGKPITPQEAETLFDRDTNEAKVKVTDEFIIGEEVIACSIDEVEGFLNSDEDEHGFSTEEIIKLADEDAQLQHTTWRASLPKETREKLLKTQHDWQTEAQYLGQKSERDKRNAFINSLPPAEIKSETPIERGMILHITQLKEFLRPFRLGEDVDMPPSGFSSNKTEARSYCKSYRGSEVGVLIRILPKDGKINGIRLHGLNEDNAGLFDSKSWEMMSTMALYESEKEVIRPSGPLARCVGIKKLVYEDTQSLNKPVRATYIIDLEDQGYPDAIHEDIKRNNSTNPVFEKIMNTSFGSLKPKNTKDTPIKLKALAQGALK
ncbi:MAG: hypothetical protein KY428_07505 [Bacteroidetes bacterium]|nr:hypothetical protein [Bacteroidota bacterium]